MGTGVQWDYCGVCCDSCRFIGLIGSFNSRLQQDAFPSFHPLICFPPTPPYFAKAATFSSCFPSPLAHVQKEARRSPSVPVEFADSPREMLPDHYIPLLFQTEHQRHLWHVPPESWEPTQSREVGVRLPKTKLGLAFPLGL